MMYSVFISTYTKRSNLCVGAIDDRKTSIVVSLIATNARDRIGVQSSVISFVDVFLATQSFRGVVFRSSPGTTMRGVRVNVYNKTTKRSWMTL